jgi:phage terminase large subunit
LSTALPRGRAPTRVNTLLGEAGGVARDVLEVHLGKAWPAPKWQRDIVGFSDTILGVEIWEKQIELLCAIQEFSRVAEHGGRKVSKDHSLAIAVLWWYASFPDARAFTTATTAKQVDGILYRQIRQLMAASGRCLACKRSRPDEPAPCPHSAIITGEVGQKAHTGIRSPDMREIIGYTADNAEGLAGLSGAYLMVVEDEASGIPDELHDALRGNLAAETCKHIMISNPTKTEGHFHAACTTFSHLWHVLHVSSRETPNVLEGREVIPGLASRSWIETQEELWGGPESALVQIHIDGKFVKESALTVPFPVDAINASNARWDDTIPDGPLIVGVDPAGEGKDGDESAFAPRRGKQILRVVARRGLSADAHVVEVLGLMAIHGTHGQPVRVVIDRGGVVGAKVWGAFLAFQISHPETAIELVGVDASDRAQRKPKTYDRVRDELVAACADWMRDGGALPEDAKLAGELNCFRWSEGGHVSGRAKLVSKDEMRKKLKRSPDRADAVCLSTWDRQQVGATAVQEGTEHPDAVIDPYGTSAITDGNDEGTIDPY